MHLFKTCMKLQFTWSIIIIRHCHFFDVSLQSVVAFKAVLLNFLAYFTLELVMKPLSCRTSLLLVIILIYLATTGHLEEEGREVRAEIYQKGRDVDEWWRVSQFPSRFCLSLSDSAFHIFFFSSTFCFFSSSISHSVFIQLPLILSHLPLLPSQSLSPGFSSWPSHTSSWCHFNNSQGVEGDRKCVLKSKLKWVFHCRLLIFWWQNKELASRIFFIKLVLGII